MSEIVNLNHVRKARARDEKQNHADANAIKFGRSKAARITEALQNDKARKMLDQHRQDDE